MVVKPSSLEELEGNRNLDFIPSYVRCILVHMGMTAEQNEHGFSKQVDKSWMSHLNSCL